MKKTVALLLVLILSLFIFPSCDVITEESNGQEVKMTSSETSDNETQTQNETEPALEQTEEIQTKQTETEKQTEKETEKETTATKKEEPQYSPVQPVSDSEDMVWIPTNGGTKYHNKPNCSNMKDPSQVTKSSAIAQGFSPCKKCY